MGLLQKAVETYDAHKNLVGQIREGHQVLAPVSHIVTSANLQITVNADGAFRAAQAVDKKDPKIAIPATEASAGRTSGICSHPLCDQLGYIAAYDQERHEQYLQQLRRWASSAFTHPKLTAILRYVEGETILEDLVNAGLLREADRDALQALDKTATGKQGKWLIRWCVVGCADNTPTACWEDETLFQAFIRFYAQDSAGDDAKLCMITGNLSRPAQQHPKGIIAAKGNAKLISSNDTSNFTYRGRFTEAWQAATVSYEASQKAHSALCWLAAEQGYRVVFGGRTFLCWNPKGTEVPKITNPFCKIDEPLRKPSEYRDALRAALDGYRATLPDQEDVVIAVFDAATDGRLAVTYYGELRASDFLMRLHDWDSKCCWCQGEYGIQSPPLWKIVAHAFGTQQEEKGKTVIKPDDRVLRQQMQRLVACRTERARIPPDLVKALVNRASTPQAYDRSLWLDVLHTACAVLNQYQSDYRRENAMEWPLDKPNRSFQFGRLLAVMERLELDFQKKAGEERQPVALSRMTAFRQHPWRLYEQINRHLNEAYLYRVEPWQRKRYVSCKEEIISLLQNVPAQELDRPLDDIYLMGYDLQRNEFFKPKKDNSQEETDHE